MRRLPLLAFAFLAGLAALSGCRGYRAGSLMHPDIRSVSIGDVKNQTPHPGLSTQVRNELARELARSAAATLVRPAAADAVLHVTITESSTEAIANTQVREPVDGEESADVRQPVLYRTRVTLHGRLKLPRDGTPVVERSAKGYAEFDRTPEVPEARRAASEQAIRNAVQHLVSTITQAW